MLHLVCQQSLKQYVCILVPQEVEMTNAEN